MKITKRSLERRSVSVRYGLLILGLLATAAPSYAQSKAPALQLALQLSCNSLRFGVTSPATTPSRITCIKAIGRSKSVEKALWDHVAHGDQLPNVVLSWIRSGNKGAYLDVVLTDVTITSVEFTQEAGTPIAEITVQYSTLDF